MGALQAPLERLDAAWTGLRDDWTAARASWHDVVAVRFEREFILPLEDAVPELLARLEDLARALDDARDAFG